MRRFTFIVAAALSLFSATSSFASVGILQPNEANSQDVFVYQFLPFNFDTTNNTPLGPGQTIGNTFGPLLASGKSTSGSHDTASLIQFDLTNFQPLLPGDTAKLNLYVTDTTATGFGKNPSAAHPITIDVYANAASWGETTATWSNKPAVGSLVDSLSINSINQYVSFDVTSAVLAWQANPSTNFGLSLYGNALVTDSGQAVVAVFESSAGANAPSLSVPEPTSMGLIGLASVLLYRRRRSA